MVCVGIHGDIDEQAQRKYKVSCIMIHAPYEDIKKISHFLLFE